MRYHDVTLHGIEEAVPQSDGSVRLQRVPEEVRARLEEPAQEKTLLAAGAEIRFVLRGTRARLTLSAEGLQEFQPTARVFYGPLAGRPHVFPIGTEPTTIDVGIGDDQRRAYESIPDDLAAAMPFHPRVVRVVLFRGIFRLHDVEGDVRTPDAASCRTHYLVKQVGRERPVRPVFCITIYPYYGDWSNVMPDATAPPEDFRLALERVVERLRRDGLGSRIELVPGPSVLTDVGGLCVDMIHPGDHGMLQMGERLAARMRPAVERLRATGVNRRRGGIT